MEKGHLLHLIEHRADEIARSWVNAVQKHPDTSHYHQFSKDRLRDNAFAVYSHLGTWLVTESKQLEEDYERFGAKRFNQGFELHEVVKALQLARRHLWSFMLQESVSDSAGQLYQMIELHNKLILFFDRAIHCTVKGYEREARLSQRLEGSTSQNRR